MCVFKLVGKRPAGSSDTTLLKQLKAFIKEEMGRQTEDLIEELKLLHDKQRNDRFRATADDRKERQKNTLILAEMESVRNEVSKLRRDIKNIFRIPGKQSSSNSRHVSQKRDKRSGRHRKKHQKTRHRKWHSKYSSTSEDSELESLSDTEDSDSTEEETTEEETDSSQESIDEKYFKTDKYKPRPTKTRNSNVSKVCTLQQRLFAKPKNERERSNYLLTCYVRRG